MSKFREMAIQSDLKPDKSYSLKGNVIRYVSIGKYKRILSPIFVRAGLEFSFHMIGVEDLPLVTRITVEFTFTDVATGERLTDTIIADGSNTQPDKAIPIAMSYALRMLLSVRFMLEDGIDYDDGESVSDALDRIAVPETPKQAVPQETVKADEPKQSEKEVVKPSRTEDAVKDVPKDVQGGEKPSKAVNLAPMEKSAANKCMRIIEDAYTAGILVEDTYLKAKQIFENLSCTADVTALMQIKSEIPIKGKKEGF